MISLILRRFIFLLSLCLLSSGVVAEAFQNDPKGEPQLAERSKGKASIKHRAPKRISDAEWVRERLSFSFGAYVSQGDYGTNKTTDTLSIPFRLTYSQRDWRVSAHLPYLYIRGPASVIAISDGVEVIDRVAQGERRRWGNGDLKLSAQHRIFRSPGRAFSAYSGLTVKVPIASETDGLSSGEFDYSFFTGGHLRSGNWVSNGRIGYQLMGDTDRTDYKNRWYASLGGYYRFDKQVSVGFSVYHKEKALDTSDDIQTFSTYLNWRMKQGWRVSVSTGLGFTDASSDMFGGVQFTKSLVRKRRAISDET